MKLDDEYFELKANSLWEDLVNDDDGDKDVALILEMLKEVSKDTTRACAELIADNPYPFNTNRNSSHFLHKEGEVAHARKCMEYRNNLK